MATYNVGDAVEAQDEGCVWSRGKIVAREGEEFVISFDGFSPNTTATTEKMRPVTHTEASLPTKRPRHHHSISMNESQNILKKLQAGDNVYVRGTGEARVVEVDPINGKLMAEVVADGAVKEFEGEELCSPPKVAKVIRERRATKRKGGETLRHVSEEDQSEPSQAKTMNNQAIDKCVFLFFLRDDGMWLRVGDIVTVEGMSLPFIICRLSMGEGCVTARLVKVLNSVLEDNFVITCGIEHIVGYLGGKVALKGLVKEKVEQDAFVEYGEFMESNGDVGVRTVVRKQLLGHAMRVGLQGGFGNLSYVKISLGPSDILLDNNIFKFPGITGVCKFFLVVDGDFEYLDSIMGRGWDYKLGRGEDSFFKFFTEVHVKRSTDLCISILAKFAQSQFVFSPSYRQECCKAVIEGREQMKDIQL